MARRKGPKALKRANKGGHGDQVISPAAKKAAAANKHVSINQLMETADASLAQFQIEAAMEQYNFAARLLREGHGKLSSETNREECLLAVLEKLGESKVSIGDREGALRDFREALNISEATSSSQSDKSSVATSALESQSCLLFYIGQLSVGQEALHAYEEGIQRLETCLAKMDPDAMDESNCDNVDDTRQATGVTAIHQKLSNAYCTVAELYLTDPVSYTHLTLPTKA